MTLHRKHVLFCVTYFVIIGGVPVVWAQDHVAETVHNLSASGPGAVRAVSEAQICVFCHAPHNNSGESPLWNRETPVSNYQIYQSSTLDAEPGQPIGSSKLCLSCHDGTIALGSILSRSDRIRMVGGDFIPSGLTNLGTDLSDDHPISFVYDSGLAGADPQLASPQSLPLEIKLDPAHQIQCTTCHDAHHNVHGKFLVLNNVFGALCTACHSLNGWSSCAHEASGTSVAGAPAGDWPYLTVAENACRSCHRPHAAGGHERLLIFEDEEDNCLICHDGLVATRNIQAELDKISSHDPRLYLGIHDPVETLSGSQDHVECVDCHNSHAVVPQPPQSSYIPIGATLSMVPGTTSGGTYIAEAQYEYEVCFRCHGDSAVQVSGRIIRQAHTENLRLKFSPTNPSFHSVVTSSPSPDTVSLNPGIPHGSLLRCTNCHNNDNGPGVGGGGPDGPHGSIYDFLLERNYTVADDTPESAFEYALCYQCHQRTSILNDESFKEHKKHIEGERSPCSACHEPHGIERNQVAGSDHTHLINFDTLIVQPEPSTGQMKFTDLGTFAGSCTLICHGVAHIDEDYHK